MKVITPPTPSHPHTHRQRSMSSMWSCNVMHMNVITPPTPHPDPYEMLLSWDGKQRTSINIFVQDIFVDVSYGQAQFLSKVLTHDRTKSSSHAQGFSVFT